MEGGVRLRQDRGMSMSAALRTATRTPFLQVAKSAIATAGAWLLAGWLVQGPPPVFAAIAALLVVQPSLNQSFAKGIERTVGVVIGVLIASLLGVGLGNGTWVVLIAIGAALALSWLLRMTPGTGNQVAISAMLVLALGTATPGYAVDRILETLIGAAVGFIVNVAIVPPVTVAPAARAVAAVGYGVADAMDRLVGAVRTPQNAEDLDDLLRRARAVRPLIAHAEAALRDGADSLALNPRARRHRARLADHQALLERFWPIATQLTGMTRAFCDRYDVSLGAEPTMTAIGEQLTRAAHDIRLLLANTAGIDAPEAVTVGVAADGPALTMPLVVLTPSSNHWVLIGSLLVDLERIHAALSDDTAFGTAASDRTV